jgi:RecA/RadA recombinase
MAKKSKSIGSIDNLFGELDKVNPFATSDFKKTNREVGFIDSGNWILNAALSGSIKRGFPDCKITNLAGESGAGKTFICMNLIRTAQQKGYLPIYYDTEGAIDPSMLEKLGIDISNGKFRYEPISEIEKLKTSFAILIKNLIDIKLAGNDIPKIIIFIDSIGMVASSKEIEDAKTGNSAADMTRAKQIRSFFRIITSDLNNLGIPMIFTNHVLANIGGYGDVVVQGGGGGVQFSPSVTLFLSKSKIKDDKDDDKRQTGIWITAKTNKNRFSQPLTVKFPVYFNKPFNRYLGVQDYFSWENCGIAKGNILTESEVSKLKGAEAEKVIKFTPTGSDKIMYFVPKETARNWVVEHLGESVSIQELFTARVMEPIADRLDVVIRKDFEFVNNDSDISDILGEEE